jgi:hypothetical protein
MTCLLLMPCPNLKMAHTKSALVAPFWVLVVETPLPERLYKIVRFAEKGDIQPGFGISYLSVCLR